MSSATVKSLSIKAYAIDKNGQRRELKVGDSLDNGEIVKTAIGGGGAATLELENGKDITLLSNDTLKLDLSTLQTNSFDPDVTNIADANSLQQAILNGEDLSDLQATAAGGGAPGAGGDGISLGAAGFDEGGHESNVNANTRNLSSTDTSNVTATNVTAGNPTTADTTDNQATPSQPSNPAQPDNTNQPSQPSEPNNPNESDNPSTPTDPNTPEPSTPEQPGNTNEPNNTNPTTPTNPPVDPAPVTPPVVVDTTKFILPDSVYNKEAYGGINLGLRVEENHRNGDDLNSFNQAFENSKSLFDNNGIALNTTAPGVTEVDNSSGFFEYNKGWFYNADSGIYIGTDSSAKLIVTSADKVDSYIQSEPDAFVITSQADDPRGGGIIDSIYGGNGNTEILIDGVVVANLLTGKGDDDVKVIGDENGEMPSGAVVIDTGSGDDAVVLDKNAVSELVFSEAGDDRVEILGGTQAGGVYLGDGDDSVVLNGGASVVGIYTEAGNDTVSIDEAKIDELGMGGIGFVNLGDGDDKLNAKNSDFKDPHDALADSGQEIYNINAGAGNDKVNIEGSNLKRAVLLGEGDDELNVKNSTSLHPEAERNPNESDVLFKFQNAIGAGAGDDDITLENFNTDRYVALGEGNDSLWVTNNSAVNAIFGEAGDDTIDISNASKVQNIAAGVGDDTINVTDAGTVVSGVIKGGNAADDGAESGADTFRIENGANVNVIKSSAGAMNNYVYVGGAEVGSIHMGSTQEASTGENMITVTNEAIVIGDILAGRGVDNIEISEGARVVGIVAGEGYEDVRANLGANDVITVRNAEAGFVQGGAGDDTLTISYGAHINGSVTLSDGTVIKGYVSGQQGNDTIVITGKETIVDGVVRGAEEASVQSDTITVSNEATVKGNVTGSAGNDDITINNANVESFIRGYAGDDDITVENGANVSGAINADVGNDTVSIQNSSVGGFVSGYTGNDEINISGSSISGIIEGGDGNDSISINESSNVQNVNAGNGNDAISIENSTASGWIWGFGGDNEISVSNSSVNQIFGGDGNDDITLENSSANLIDTQAGNDKLTLNNEPNINLNTVKNIETLEVRNNDGAKLELSAKDVIDMTDNRNSLNIVGEKDSSGVELSHEFTQKDGSQEYSATDSSVTFIIEPDQQ